MIDWEKVRELRDEIGAGEFPEVVALFLDEVEQVTARLASSPDPARFEEDLHFLKGSALNLGFRSFSDMCGHGERLAVGGHADRVDIDALLTCYAASKQAFLKDFGLPVTG